MILRKECSQIIEQILDSYGDFLGKDREGYTNHCIRVAHLCLSIASEKPSSLEKICISAAFHDLGIWTAQTFDYLEPSENLAKRYLVSMGKQEWESEIISMISNHHKVSPCKEENMGLTEAFLTFLDDRYPGFL